MRLWCGAKSHVMQLIEQGIKVRPYLFDKLEVIAHLAPPMGELSAQPTERALSAPYGGTSPMGRGKRGFAANPSNPDLEN